MTFYDAYIILLGKLGMSHNTLRLENYRTATQWGKIGQNIVRLGSKSSLTYSLSKSTNSRLNVVTIISWRPSHKPV